MTSAAANVIDGIRQWRPDAVVDVCADEGCCLRTDAIPSHVIVKGDCAVTDRKMCDCIIVVERDPVLVVIAELRSKSVRPDEVIEKLTNATNLVRGLLRELKCHEFEVVHVVLAKKWNRTSEFRVLTNRRVKCGNDRYRVVPRKCSEQLSHILRAIRVPLGEE